MRKRLLFLSFVLCVIPFIYSCNNDVQEKKDVRHLVERFGEQLKKVSLLAPDSLLIPQLKKTYQPYVTKELLRAWIANASTAPGRKTSSPWPEKIEIDQLSKIKDGLYRVRGEVIYVTSVEKANDGTAISRGITIEVTKIRNETWKISKFQFSN